ncbi:MAG: B12-binding domain-containing radical SAM protein [Rhodospirillales bacterium]
MRANEPPRRTRTFNLYLIKPSHYDDDGYVIQWLRSDIPSNTLAVLRGIADDCHRRRVLGDDVEIVTTAIDETNTRVRPERIVRAIRAAGGRGMVGLIGVQSNQFPRAVDLGRRFRAAGIPVCIGGFHASGSLSMLPAVPPEIQDAMDLGISIFAGEAEEQFDQVLTDAWHGALKPLYNVMAKLPNLEGAVLPLTTPDMLERRVSSRASFDSGRGCPFQCSFCTIINVQGRKSRYRTADDVEAILRDGHARGIRKFFITDDNFARNGNWEGIFDRIVELRERDGMKFGFIIQVDTLCHQIPGFVAKAGRAGVNRVFIGLENVNPDNLIAAKKKQNRITEYRAMLQAWKSIGAATCAGYIIGFPNDTRERVLRDIEIIKRELPVDLVEFFCLTPLPGSEDHKILDAKGVWMDPDMNNYDTEHVTTAHPLMSDAEFMATYREAWHAFYTPEHIETVLRRAAASGLRPSKILGLLLYFYGSQAIEGIHPLQGGLFRRKHRRDRRHGLPLENPLVFYPRHLWEMVAKTIRIALFVNRYRRICRRVETDPNRHAYTDLALTPATDGDLDTLEMFTNTASAVAVADKVRARAAKAVPVAAPAVVAAE